MTPTLLMAFGIGLVHAIEADHLAAVLTFVASGKGDSKQAARTGLWWGVGHTATILLVGLLAVLLHVALPNTALTWFERLVGLALIALGLALAANRLHTHEPAEPTKPSLGSFLIGFIHGLAGSGTIIALMVTAAPTPVAGLGALVAFGMGSTIAMITLAAIMSLPVRFLNERALLRTSLILRFAVGIFSVLIGLRLLF